MDTYNLSSIYIWKQDEHCLAFFLFFCLSWPNSSPQPHCARSFIHGELEEYPNWGLTARQLWLWNWVGMLVGDKAHMNFERKLEKLWMLTDIFFPCMTIAMRAQKCLWGVFRLVLWMNESPKLDTQWGVVRWLSQQTTKARWSCLNWLQWKVLMSQDRSVLGNYSLGLSLETGHFHEGLSDVHSPSGCSLWPIYNKYILSCGSAKYSKVLQL